MKFRTSFLSTVAMVALAVPSQAASIFSDQASYFAAINAGTAFTNTFNTSAGAPNYSLNGFAYTLTTTPNNQLYFSGGGPSGSFVGAFFAADNFIVTFTSGNISAVGGNFFLTNQLDVFQAAPITVNLSDGTSDTFTPAALTDYRGYTTSTGVFITSLVLPGWNGIGTPTFAGFDNFTVGQALPPGPANGAVPVPATALLGLAALPVLGFIRRKRS